MEHGELNYILDYVLSSWLGNIKRKGNKEYKRVIINDTEYRYNKEKPITGKLKTKLEQIAKTQEFKRFDVWKRATKGIAVRKALTNYAIKQKAKITDEQSAFKRYANSYSISNINMKGYKGLSYLKHQYNRLEEFLIKNNNMKIRIGVDVAFNHPEQEEPQSYKITSRIYTIINKDELKEAINNMASDIEIKIENSQLKRSGYSIDKTEK